ncbi:MAG: hypothetical protein QOI21_4332 [Actinomycetota bacterium]|jgi:hypothetical protein|nr:hypothetical protein [Actinomycetota bacterium]
MNALLPVLPYHRAIVAVDIEGSTTRTNPVRAQLRRVLYELLEEALLEAGITDEHRDPLIDRGDGILVLIHPVTQAPKTVLLSRVIPKLTGLLAQHAAEHPDHQFRLRAAVHAGDVHYDTRGCYGEDIDITFRLLNSPTLKKTLKQTSEPLVLVVSQEIHRSVIRHGYDGIDVRAFDPRVHVQIAGQRVRGWIQIPGPRQSTEDGIAS